MPHPGRYFFLEAFRKAGAEKSIIEENCDHGLTTGSTSQGIYGFFPNEVLLREA